RRQPARAMLAFQWVNDEAQPDADGQASQDPEWDGHQRRRLVRMSVGIVGPPEEGDEDHAEHVKRREERGQCQQHERPRQMAVEEASPRLMSLSTQAMVAARSAVKAPTQAMSVSIPGTSSKSGIVRVTMKTPAVTIVAAWMSAETGVGPSIASGSQTWSGNWADFPHAPMKRSRAIPVAAAGESVSAALKTAA